MNVDRECTTHHHACDCREAEFARIKTENQWIKEHLRIAIGRCDAFALLYKGKLISEALTAQRDELLEALQSLYDEFKSITTVLEQALKGGK
jgi:hypothetical protein